jgi:hypothetical protein
MRVGDCTPATGSPSARSDQITRIAGMTATIERYDRVISELYRTVSPEMQALIFVPRLAAPWTRSDFA